MTETERREYDDALRKVSEERAKGSGTNAATEAPCCKYEPTDAIPAVRAELYAAR